jgi:uncharacterized 2Fe-2S/4Fe-4S cluster protein (DUF4445 family)
VKAPPVPGDLLQQIGAPAPVPGGPALHLTLDGVAVEARAGMSLFECAEIVGVPVPTSCFKQGRCRECLVEVESGEELLSPRTAPEEHLDGRFRLSCQARLLEQGEAAAGVVRAHTLRRGSMRIEGESTGLVGEGPNAILDPAVTRGAGGRAVLLDGKPIAEVEPGSPILGLAVDLGTTTVALRLYDLESGVHLASASFENPQRFGGSDVLARIRYDGEHAGRLLQRTLLAYLEKAIVALPCDPRAIYELVLAGNPTMRDLFFGLDVAPIGVLPYRSVTESALRAGETATTSVASVARKLRLPLHPEARVYGMPLIASHVGADAAACLLATGLADADEVTALLDIGTNTEVLVGNRDRILAASCPAGPAFEGGGVACGMPALHGAIERVHLADAPEDDRVEIAVIGGGSPEGICGSGLVDLLSELLRTGRMNEQGRLAHDSGPCFLDRERDIFLAEADINELAQAKGANVAGFELVVSSYGLTTDRLTRVDLAGGFARHLDLAAAKRIGLLPDLPEGRIRQVGNAALEGAAIALRSRSRREFLEATVRRIEHVRLEAHPRFFDVFVEGCQFKPWQALAEGGS